MNLQIMETNETFVKNGNTLLNQMSARTQLSYPELRHMSCLFTQYKGLRILIGYKFAKSISKMVGHQAVIVW